MPKKRGSLRDFGWWPKQSRSHHRLGNTYEFVSGKWSQTDYDFQKPSTSLHVGAAKHGGINIGNSGYELYDNPNDYVNKDDGRSEASRRMEEEEARYDTCRCQHLQNLRSWLCVQTSGAPQLSARARQIVCDHLDHSPCFPTRSTFFLGRGRYL